MGAVGSAVVANRLLHSSAGDANTSGRRAAKTGYRKGRSGLTTWTRIQRRCDRFFCHELIAVRPTQPICGRRIRRSRGSSDPIASRTGREFPGMSIFDRHFLGPQFFDQIGGLLEGHVAIVVAMDQQHGGAPVRDACDWRLLNGRSALSFACRATSECVVRQAAAKSRLIRRTAWQRTVEIAKIDAGFENVEVAGQSECHWPLLMSLL